MSAQSVSSYYVKAILGPSVLALVGDIVLGAIDAEQNKNYKSEWLDEGTMLLVIAVMSLLHTGLVYILSLTLFLTEKDSVSESAVLRPLAWFLLPMSWLGYLLGSALWDMFLHEFTAGSFWVVLNTIPYIVGLVLNYFKFRAELENSRLSISI